MMIMLHEEKMVFIGTAKGMTKGDIKVETRNATFNYANGEEDCNFKFYTSDPKIVSIIDGLKKYSECLVVINIGTYKEEVNVRLHDVIDPSWTAEAEIAPVVEVTPEQQQLEGVKASNVANVNDPVKGGKK